MTDLIQRLRELRQSSQSSVVTGIETTRSEQRPSIEHPLEGWLVDLILDQLTTPKDRSRSLSLIVLSGNAGDGKSYLLREVRERLIRDGLDPKSVQWLLDATESSNHIEKSVDRLMQYFEPFGDAAKWNESELHVVAMNTGTVVRFVDHAKPRSAFKVLSDVLYAQLAIRVPEEQSQPGYWERFDRVLVVDLDRRMMLPLENTTPSFVDQMLDTLDRSKAQNFLSEAAASCPGCRFAAQCPVNANLLALRNGTVRRRLNALLRDVTLEDRVHIGPRGLWHALYQMTVGGLDDAALESGSTLPTCADVGALNDETRARSLFFTSLFEGSDADDAGAPGLARELARVDPALRFTIDLHETALAAGLSSKEDLRLAEQLAPSVGVNAAVIVGSKIDPQRRSMAAVRRAYFMQEAEPNPTESVWLDEWANSLATHRRDILTATSTRHTSVKLLIDVLREIYGLRGRNNVWRLKLPWRNQTNLYTPLEVQPGQRRAYSDPRVLGPDHCRKDGVRQVAKALSEKLGSYPVAIVVPLRDGPEVRITWPLYRLLKRVDNLKYIAASLDPERIQNLERIGASLGAVAAIDKGVAVIEGPDGGTLCRDDGGGGVDVVDL